MNKIIIDNIAFAIQRIGGISVVWYEIIKRLLSDKKYDTEFIECNRVSNNYYRALLDIPSKLVKKFSSSFYIVARYWNPKLNITDPYIFHSTYYRVSRDQTAINFTTVHDFVYERCGKRNFRTKLHIWQQKRAVMKSDFVICISQNTKSDLLYYYKDVDPDKVFVVYNGVSTDYCFLDRNEKRHLPFLPNTYCVFVGARRAYKNFKLAVESLASTQFNLFVVGPQLTDAEIAYLDEVLGRSRYCSEYNVSNERLNEIYNFAFALLYLSEYEGFGIPCLEAQRAGCPVVAMNTSSIPEVVCERKLLISQADTLEVVEKLNLLLNIDFRKKVIAEGAMFAKQFSWDRCYRELSKIYDMALKNNNDKK